MNPLERKPDARDGHVRFDERGVETEPMTGYSGTGNRKGRKPLRPGLKATAPLLDSTSHFPTYASGYPINYQLTNYQPFGNRRDAKNAEGKSQPQMDTVCKPESDAHKIAKTHCKFNANSSLLATIFHYSNTLSLTIRLTVVAFNIAARRGGLERQTHCLTIKPQRQRKTKTHTPKAAYPLM
jgi:hypothetical protein